jgi:Niemann-Pick C1 protein
MSIAFFTNSLFFILQHVKVFPYSIFYVFYEQYLTMWSDTLQSLGISLLAIFIVTFFLMGFDLCSSVVILTVIIMILVDTSSVLLNPITA